MSIATKVKGGKSLVGVPVSGGRFSLAPAATVTASEEPWLPYDLTLEVELLDGRYAVTELRACRKAGGDPVTTDGLRAIPLARILMAAFEGAVLAWKRSPGGDAIGAPIGPWHDEQTRVAAIYLLAYACGQAPTKAVAQALGIPQSTAAKKVMKARRDPRGLLGETTPGQAGERT